MFDAQTIAAIRGYPLNPDATGIKEIDEGQGIWSVGFAKNMSPEAVLSLFKAKHASVDIQAISLRECGEVRIWTIVTKEICGR